MLSCRDVTRLVAGDGLAGKGMLLRLSVRLHVLYCRHCRKYVRQLKAIGDAARRLALESGPDPVRLAELQQTIRTMTDREKGKDA